MTTYINQLKASVLELHGALSSWVEVADDEDQRDSDFDALDRAAFLLDLEGANDRKAFYAITGRICGDDENTVLVVQASSRELAIDEYIESMWELEGCSVADRERAEDNGEGVFIDSIVRSLTPIVEV